MTREREKNTRLTTTNHKKFQSKRNTNRAGERTTNCRKLRKRGDTQLRKSCPSCVCRRHCSPLNVCYEKQNLRLFRCAQQSKIITLCLFLVIQKQKCCWTLRSVHSAKSCFVEPEINVCSQPALVRIADLHKWSIAQSIMSVFHISKYKKEKIKLLSNGHLQLNLNPLNLLR